MAILVRKNNKYPILCMALSLKIRHDNVIISKTVLGQKNLICVVSIFEDDTEKQVKHKCGKFV